MPDSYWWQPTWLWLYIQLPHVQHLPSFHILNWHLKEYLLLVDKYHWPVQIKTIQVIIDLDYKLLTILEVIWKGHSLNKLPPILPKTSGSHDFLPSLEKKTPVLPNFSLSAMHEYLVKFVIADDQVVKTRSTPELSLGLVSDGTWLQRLRKECCTLVKSLFQISEWGDNSEVTLNIAQQRSRVVFQRRVRDSSRGSEGSGILVDIWTEGNTWLGSTVLILQRCTGLVTENGAE